MQGFRSEDMQAWRQHWNHQLYKALEHQYQKGLEGLNKNLPEIQIDLTFRSVPQSLLSSAASSSESQYHPFLSLEIGKAFCSSALHLKRCELATSER